MPNDRRDLQQRIETLSGEIRGYPTPIARCDEQLGALIEERARLIEQLGQPGGETPCGPLANWINDGGFHGA
jgi:hypothetical protein